MISRRLLKKNLLCREIKIMDCQICHRFVLNLSSGNVSWLYLQGLNIIGINTIMPDCIVRKCEVQIVLKSDIILMLLRYLDRYFYKDQHQLIG